MTAAHTRKLLAESATLLETTWAGSLSDPERLHDLLVQHDTPGQLQSGRCGPALRCGIHASPFGPCLLAESERGVAALSFVHDGDEQASLDTLRQRWPTADLTIDSDSTAATMRRIIDGLQKGPDRLPRIDVSGTNFQVRVWSALLQIPSGRLVSYEQLAKGIGHPAATRAAASAVAANPVLLLIPCHRVIRKNGAFGNYSGGAGRKRAIVAWEAAPDLPVSESNSAYPG